MSGIGSGGNRITLMWSGGSTVTVAQGAYFDELTPMVLTSDTRVTNHGYHDGRPTPHQAVLQAGTAVRPPPATRAKASPARSPSPPIG